MPTSLYGLRDDFDPETARVMAAFIRKFGEAGERGLDEVTVWGEGTPHRDFLHVDGSADTSFRLFEETHGTEMINIGVGKDFSICELAECVADELGCRGDIVSDV